MKKIFLFFIAFVFCQANCYASNLKAVALNDFTTLDNSAKIKIYVAEDFYLTSKLLIPQGSVLVGSIKNIKEPKKLKRNADFDFEVVYYMDNQKYKYRTELPLCGNYGAPNEFDKNNAKKNAAINTTGFIVPGFSNTRNAFNGAKQRKKGRIKGALSNIYQHSFLSYKEKGSHLNIKKGDCFYISFPIYDKEEYTFENLFSQIDNYGNPLFEKRIDGTLKDTPKSELEPNYPYKHQYNSRVFYLSIPKK